jgi:hypothetical protein
MPRLLPLKQARRKEINNTVSRYCVEFRERRLAKLSPATFPTGEFPFTGLMCSTGTGRDRWTSLHKTYKRHF